MDMELLKLQKEIKELREQNFQRQNDIQYIPFNIISNNLYINNSLNKSSINANLPQNNNMYNSLIFEQEIQKKRRLEQKRRTPFGKLPIKRGMFSYKTSLNNNNYINYNNYINNDIYRNNSKNIIENNEPKYNFNNINKDENKYNNANNSLLSAELKLNLDDNNDIDDMEQNRDMGEKEPSASYLDLNKYKINKTKDNQKKNIIIPKIQLDNISNRILNNNFNNNNSIMNKSQIIGINQNNIEPKNNSSMVIDNKKIKIIKIADHFKNSPKYEKESRRMIIEYLKILNKKEYKNKKVYSLEDIKTIMGKNKISKKVLNKEYEPEEFNSSNVFNNSMVIEKNKENDAKSKAMSFGNNILNKTLNNIIPNFNEINNKSKSLTKNLTTPIKKNISNFLNKMNDAKQDKINIIAFLSIPRIMNLYFMDKKYKFICVLSPNIICYKDAIESYIFKFGDINKKQFVGGFDLIKIKICSKIPNRPNNFYIETFNGNNYRKYEFETKSPYLANNYVKTINYLTQLVKCKLYDFKNNYKNKKK